MDTRTHHLEHLADEQLIQYFRWYWMIEARIFTSLCRLKGSEPELGLQRRMPDYSHHEYVLRHNEFCEMLARADCREEALDSLRRRHEALLLMIDAATGYLGERAAAIVGLAGGTVGEDMGRELRVRLARDGQHPGLPEEVAAAQVPPVETGAPAAHRRPRAEFAPWEAREQDIVGLTTSRLDHVMQCFLEGFLRGYRLIEPDRWGSADTDPAVLRSMRCSFPHRVDAPHGIDPRGDPEGSSR